MTDTALTPANETPTIEAGPTPPALPTADGLPMSGAVPRLGEAPIAPPTPLAGGVPTLPGDAPLEPVVTEAPTLTAPELPTLTAPELPTLTAPELPTLTAPELPTLAAPELPTLAAPELPTLAAPDVVPAPVNEPVAAIPAPIDTAGLPQLPDAAPATPATVEEHSEDEPDSSDDEPAHPMAHLMPAKSKPSAAQQRAAEIHAVKKKKATKIKIGVAAVALIVSALVGPPLVSWLTTAIGEAGSSPSEEPAD